MERVVQHYIFDERLINYYLLPWDLNSWHPIWRWVKTLHIYTLVYGPDICYY